MGDDECLVNASSTESWRLIQISISFLDSSGPMRHISYQQRCRMPIDLSLTLPAPVCHQRERCNANLPERLLTYAGELPTKDQ